MIRNLQTRSWLIILALTIIVTSLAAFWLGRIVFSPLIPAVRTQPTPAALIAMLREGQIEQTQGMKQLLGWCERLSQTPTSATLEDRVAVFHAIELFGDLRYAPAVHFLVLEAFGGKGYIAWADPNRSPFQDERSSLESGNHALAALVKIGRPAVVPLLKEYVRLWKMNRQHPNEMLATLEYSFSKDPLLGSTLKHIQTHYPFYVKMQFGEADRDEVAAVVHLKRELLKPFELE